MPGSHGRETVNAEDGHVRRRDDWLAAHHERWSSPESLLLRIVRDAGLAPARFERLLAGQANEVYAVAYLGDGGYTLTSVLDFKTKHLTGFASNEK